MEKIYNPSHQRLEFYQQEADSGFWDDHWNQQWQGPEENFVSQVICKKNYLVSSILEKYAPLKNTAIIEAGCGNGHVVYFMNYLGYRDVQGIDFASQTVSLINRFFPALKISCQDVRKTNFPNQTFDLYFSFGVIEHFYEGYESIINEAKRITRTGGYLAISFPQMSLLRKIKSQLGFYSKKIPAGQKGFYQFALDPQKVTKELKDNFDLNLQEIIFYDGLKTLKDEISPLRPWLRKLYNYRGSSPWIKKFKSRLDRLAKPWAGHMAMRILQNG